MTAGTELGGYRWTVGTATADGGIGIRELSERTGLSMDTLRWYEREGLLPLVERTASGQRRYGPAAVRFVRLVQALRRTGMPIADIRAFVRLGGGQLAHHAERMAMLERQREAVADRIAQLHDDAALIEEKIAQYTRLIAQGLDCEDAESVAVAG